MKSRPVPDKIQFREDPATLKWFIDQGLNPNEVAREAFEAEYRRRKGDDWLARLRELQKGMKAGPPLDPGKAVRDMRDERAEELDRRARRGA